MPGAGLCLNRRYGNSYYSRAIDQIRQFLNCPEDCSLFPIDEIFRGTNTIERMAIGAATLRYLGRRNIEFLFLGRTKGF
jgi:DNA mismatch repair ATPase MutS